MAPRQPTAATDGQDERLDRDAGGPASAGGDLVGEHLERPEAASRRAAGPRRPRRVGGSSQPRQADDGHRQEREVATAPSGPPSRRWYASRSCPPRLPGRPRRAGRLAVAGVEDVARLDPRPARLADAPAHVVELARSGGRPSRSRGGSPSATARRARSTARSSRWRRAVHLERRAGPRGLGVDRVPVEVEVVARRRSSGPTGGR